ncbi:hypothetical protein J3A83DRAFT_4238138 [Scleroderma citrinum]
MDDLAQARVELVRLEEKAQELLDQLLEVRAAVSAQRTKISNLVRQKPPPIHRLPTELLMSILDLNINDPFLPCHRRRWELAMVSPLWRDVILDNPIFWTTIDLGTLSIPTIKMHLKRSGKSLLDIVMNVDVSLTSVYDTLCTRMRVVLPHVHRWRTLDVLKTTAAYYGSRGVRWTVEELIDATTDHCLEFPSLKCAVIPCAGSSAYPDFLSSAHLPSLEHLELEYCRAWEDFAPPSTLKSLKLIFERSAASFQYPLFPRLIPTQTLSTLSLEGDICDWYLQPNSIQFPVLKTLILVVSRTNKLLQAIVAPNLEHFDYRFDYEGIGSGSLPPSVIFHGLGHKFTSVRRISFPDITMDHRSDHDPNALPLCEAFPNVRHVECGPQDLTGFLMACLDAKLTHTLYPIDFWKDLQSLTLRGRSDLWSDWYEGLNQLPGWLIQRQRSDLPLLHIKLVQLGCSGSSVDVADYFWHLHNCLRDYCRLEFNFPMAIEINLSTVANSLGVMRFPELPPPNLMQSSRR